MKLGKMVVLKPVVWNNNNYTWPAGIAATSGFSHDHGYGHEEWNGRSDWIWDGWKVFHTQAKGKMHEYAAQGRLGIIMTTMIDGSFYAVGVGCNVYENYAEENSAIADALDLAGYADQLWDVEAIRTRKNEVRSAFDKHWQSHLHVNWRCPQTHFAWFGKPVRIVPNDLIPSNPSRQAIVKMHGSYQAIRPDQALSIVRSALAPEHAIIAWLSTTDFDPVRNKRVQNAKPPKSHGWRSASTSPDPIVRYMQEYEMIVSPLHHRLQDDFEAYLQAAGMKAIRSNIERVDLRFHDRKFGPVFVEVKPTEPSTVRFAIRTAMGQLLDYEQRACDHPSLLIVVDDEPSEQDLQLALVNGFGLAWRSEASFTVRWPREC